MVLVTRNDSNRDSLILFLFVSQAYICMLPPNFPAVELSEANIEALLEIHAAVILCY